MHAQQTTTQPFTLSTSTRYRKNDSAGDSVPAKWGIRRQARQGRQASIFCYPGYSSVHSIQRCYCSDNISIKVGEGKGKRETVDEIDGQTYGLKKYKEPQRHLLCHNKRTKIHFMEYRMKSGMIGAESILGSEI